MRGGERPVRGERGAPAAQSIVYLPVVCPPRASTESCFSVKMSSEIRLVQEIERFECLYNNFLPEYNRKDLAEDAWAQVSSSTELSVTDCKEKWRNIRSSLLRNLKPSEKPRKPYYLIPYLHFLIPFLKPINNVDSKEETTSVRSITKDPDIFICAVKSEEECQLLSDSQSFINSEVTSDDDTYKDALVSQPSSLLQKRKRTDCGTTNATNKRFDQKDLNYEPISPISTIDPPRTISDSMRYFLLSLLPEFETMSEEQIRQFKIKVMIAIDDIKTNVNKVKTDVPSKTTERLQKRLINLLLRNLEKK